MTEQQFKRKLIIRIIASAVLFATGAFLSLYVISQSVWPYAFKEGYTYGLVWGTTGAGLGTAVKWLVILKVPKYFKQRYIAESDERNKQISLKAWAWSGYISIYAILVSTLFMPEEVIKYVLCLMWIPLVVYATVYKLLQWKM